MYVNKCIKCGREFETKNPKRVICPECLYPDKKMMIENSAEEQNSQPAEQNTTQQFYSSYSAGGGNEQRPYRPAQRNQNYNGGNSRQGGGYRQNNNGGYRQNNNNRPRQGGYNNRSQGGYNNNRGGQPRRPQNNRFQNNRRPMNKNMAPKQLLVNKDQLSQIELLYKLMLPLPNPDAHEVIGEKIGLEPRKVFFGINLIRQKMMLPKLPFPKRKLAITPDQMNAIKMLYEPLLPIPPIGCHKIIAAQLKMDEWRVHVGIGLVRAQMGLSRWNQDRPDVPEEFKNQQNEATEEVKETKKTSKKSKKDTAVEEKVEETATVEAPAAEEEAPKKKRGRKPKKETAHEADNTEE